MRGSRGSNTAFGLKEVRVTRRSLATEQFPPNASPLPTRTFHSLEIPLISIVPPTPPSRFCTSPKWRSEPRQVWLKYFPVPSQMLLTILSPLSLALLSWWEDHEGRRKSGVPNFPAPHLQSPGKRLGRCPKCRNFHLLQAWPSQSSNAGNSCIIIFLS